MKKRLLLPTLIAGTSILSACGGGSSSTPVLPTQTGQLVDSAVANIAFRTATQSGFTNANGEFSFLPGETVTFSIGGIDFPPVLASSVVTPLTIVGTSNINDTSVQNISRLLQTLDSDGNPDNGITIDEQAHLTAELHASVDFSSLGFDAAVANLVANSGSILSALVSAEDAIAHLETTLTNTANTFLASLFTGVSFSVADDGDSDIQALSFNTDGTGTIQFYPRDFNNFNENDINEISNLRFSNNALSFTETDSSGDTWDWTITPTGFLSGQITFTYTVSGIEGSSSGQGSMSFESNLSINDLNELL